jgi:DNA-binding NarL/FixJ family response regulator
MTDKSPIRIAIVEDHPPIIQALSDYLKTVPEFKLVGSAKNIEGARVIIGSNEVDVVIMDIRLPDEKGNKIYDGGITLAAEFVDLYDDLAIVVYTGMETLEFVTLALNAGVRGYLLKTADVSDIKTAIEIVMSGGIYLDRDLRPDPKPDPNTDPSPKGKDPTALTPREEEILKLIAKWMTREEIARELDISLTTVNSHCSHIMDKLISEDENKNNTELIRKAIRRYGNPDTNEVRKMDKEQSTGKATNGSKKQLPTKDLARETEKADPELEPPS